MTATKRIFIITFLCFQFSVLLFRVLFHHPLTPPESLQMNQVVSRSAFNTTFLLGIFSVMEDTKRRLLIRETMLKIPEPEQLCSLQTFLASSTPDKKCQIIYTFVVGGNPYTGTEWSASNGVSRTMDASQMLKHEYDILYLNIKENMNDGKTESWFEYASSQLTTIDYISKLDSDTLVSIPQLLSYVNNHPSPRAVYGGFLNEYQACGGAGEMCDKIRGKVYMSGQFYWMSQSLASYVSQIRHERTDFLRVHNEDMDMGFRVLSYPEPISLSACNGALFWKHPLKEDHKWLEAFRELVANHWRVADSNGWIGGLYAEVSSKNLMRSVLGRIVNSEVVPIFLN